MELLRVGMVTPVGLTAFAVAAAIRAGITRTTESLVHSESLQPLVMGLVGAEYLPPLAEPLRPGGLGARRSRMLRLATLAFREVAEGWKGQPPPRVLLALPEPFPEGDAKGERPFPEQLMAQTGIALPLPECQVFQRGRAGGVLALAQALKLLSTGRLPYVCVGGVDTYLDPGLLRSLGLEQRLHTAGISDGFIPGEGAAFLWLGRPGAGRQLGITPLARISAVGTGFEKGHLLSQAPYLGEGLAEAFRELFSALPARFPKVRCVYAGLNGENHWAKEWGVAYLRNTPRFEEGARIEHPIEFIGDPGAALGPILLALAAISLSKAYRPGPCLVWCSSDRGERGAAIVEPALKA